jgi:hypothetical protein
LLANAYDVLLSYGAQLTIPVSRSSRVVFFRAEVSEKHALLCIRLEETDHSDDFFKVTSGKTCFYMGYFKLILQPRPTG